MLQHRPEILRSQEEYGIDWVIVVADKGLNSGQAVKHANLSYALAAECLHRYRPSCVFLCGISIAP